MLRETARMGWLESSLLRFNPKRGLGLRRLSWIGSLFLFEDDDDVHTFVQGSRAGLKHLVNDSNIVCTIGCDGDCRSLLFGGDDIISDLISNI